MAQSEIDECDSVVGDYSQNPIITAEKAPFAGRSMPVMLIMLLAVLVSDTNGQVVSGVRVGVCLRILRE